MRRRIGETYRKLRRCSRPTAVAAAERRERCGSEDRRPEGERISSTAATATNRPLAQELSERTRIPRVVARSAYGAACRSPVFVMPGERDLSVTQEAHRRCVCRERSAVAGSSTIEPRAHLHGRRSKQSIPHYPCRSVIGAGVRACRCRLRDDRRMRPSPIYRKRRALTVAHGRASPFAAIRYHPFMELRRASHGM